ncbi:MAG: helix-turn-helix domain-containing protein [Planctomycetales bacterium]|nr:helix-turn-helix domain-containing protein [Planctomycetales bacterium]
MPTDTTPKLLLSVPDACKALGICARTLFSLTAPRGPILSIRLGSRVLYPINRLREFIDAQTGAAEGKNKNVIEFIDDPAPYLRRRRSRFSQLE